MSWNKSKINEELSKHHQEFDALIDRLPLEVFEDNSADKWSAGQLQQHIILSLKPIILAMRLPKFLLRYQFGLTNRPPRSYEELVVRYLKALDGRAAVAPKRFTPEQIGREAKQRQTIQFNKLINRLMQLVNKWSEDDLDLYVIPHPLMGKLTFREILYFTIYHVQHHKKQMDAIVKTKK